MNRKPFVKLNLKLKWFLLNWAPGAPLLSNPAAGPPLISRIRPRGLSSSLKSRVTTRSSTDARRQRDDHDGESSEGEGWRLHAWLAGWHTRISRGEIIKFK